MIKAFVVECDWPGCGRGAEIPNRPGEFHDRYWRDLGDQHLCPEHRLRDPREIDRLRGEADAAGGL